MLNPIASSAARRAAPQPAAPLCAELERLVGEALAQGLHVEGLSLARGLIDDRNLEQLKALVFNPASLAYLRTRTTRVEFIAEGPLPPELLLEPSARQQPVFTQTVDYNLCKSCRLCIEVCPKQVYSDDGFGKPYRVRRDEECTGGTQCGECVSICPERAISVEMASPLFASTLFVQLENPYARAEANREAPPDFTVLNPLTSGEELRLERALPADDLAKANRVLDAAGFHPVLECMGTQKHFVDARDPDADLEAWAKHNGRSPEMVKRAVKLLYAALPQIGGLKEGKYSFDVLIHRLIDEMLYPDIEAKSRPGRTLLKTLLEESFEAQTFVGSKRRPIGGLLPPGTSTAWKTPYGNEVPSYTRMEKCLGPECGLCVTHCPEGNGGETAAIRMVPQVPLGTIPALVRGLRAYLLKLDGSHRKTDELEDLSGREAFRFEVNEDYCKSCGICISCCPHDVIHPAERRFDMGGAL